MGLPPRISGLTTMRRTEKTSSIQDSLDDSLFLSLLTPPSPRVRTHDASCQRPIAPRPVDTLKSGVDVPVGIRATPGLTAECLVPVTCEAGFHCNASPIL